MSECCFANGHDERPARQWTFTAEAWQTQLFLASFLTPCLLTLSLSKCLPGMGLSFASRGARPRRGPSVAEPFLNHRLSCLHASSTPDTFLT